MQPNEMIAKVGALLTEVDKNVFGYRPIKLRLIYAILSDGHVFVVIKRIQRHVPMSHIEDVSF